ncbi:signal peptidase II [Mycoplasma marinum]|uniref:Uncharacterized protein n=1 Tax=Mycoplasma marinum TaxID=1937190 RepID=A0A4R0XM46_9MOLU|nr:signal peptidase II [Mycoplasma marinum]TCG11766.1 hypothetical protein C4B24_01280 [Mycoplasma marinum]
MKKILKRVDKKIFTKNFIILCFVMGVFLAIDQFTKLALFAKISPDKICHNIQNRYVVDKGLIGTRLVTNTGMFSSLGANVVPYWGVQTLTSIVFIFLVFGALISKKTLTAVGFSLMAAGAFGNILDRFMLTYELDGKIYHYVRDWIYHPKMDRGTYNLADVEVVLGSILTATSIIINLFKEEKKENSKINKNKKIK